MRLDADSNAGLVTLRVFRILVVGYWLRFHVLWCIWDLEMSVVVHERVGIQSGVGSFEWSIVRPHDWEVAVDVFAAVASCHGHYRQ